MKRYRLISTMPSKLTAKISDQNFTLERDKNHLKSQLNPYATLTKKNICTKGKVTHIVL